MIRGLDASAVRVVAVDLSDRAQPDYFAAHKMNRFLLLRHPDAQTALSYQFRSTPQTILTNAVGKVQVSHVGLLDTSDLKRFAVQLRAN